MSDKRRTLSVIKPGKHPSKEKAFKQFKGNISIKSKKTRTHTHSSLSLEMWILIDIQKSEKNRDNY